MTTTTPSPPAREQFGDFDGRLWLNAAHQGPLPLAAAAAAVRAADLKTSPHRIADEDFTAVPERLRELLARLVGADPEEVVLGNSTSHGLHVIANGPPWTRGDEVLVVAGDYPATVLPWMRLHHHGVTTHHLQPEGVALTAEDVDAAIAPRTRVLALIWVDSFTGRALDLHAIGDLCRRRGVLLVVNASQALGARPLDVRTTPVDAVVSCGYKWLCGPYATGFTWLHPHLRDQLRPQQAYWLAMQAGRGLDQMRKTSLREDLGARALDRFCPADFLDVLPWTASLELVLDIGVETIAHHDQRSSTTSSTASTRTTTDQSALAQGPRARRSSSCPHPAGPPNGATSTCETPASTPRAVKAFEADYRAKWPKAVAKITDDLYVLLEFYNYPAEHWVHLRTTSPIESTFATVRLRQRVTKGPGSRAAGIAMAFKLIESAQTRWRAVNSTSGGTAARTVRTTRPSRSIRRRVRVSTLDATPSIRCCNAL